MKQVDQRYEIVPIARVQPHPKNAKKGDLNAIGESIDSNDFYGAIVVQKSTGYILIGNHRYLAAMARGATELPAIFVDVDDARARRIMLADNRTSDLGGYDEEKLVAELQAIAAEPSGLAGTGYDDDALAALLKSIGAEDPPAQNPPDTEHATEGGDLGPKLTALPGTEGGSLEDVIAGRARWCVIGPADIRDDKTVLPPATFHGGFCDAPYEFGILGKSWDASGVAFDAKMWGKIRASLKPGAHLLAFGGSRTFHRMVCAIEDAEFEIRDVLLWLYGVGFPKSLDVNKAIDRMKHEREEVLEVCAWVRKAAKAAGKSNAQIDKHFGLTGMAGHWTTTASQPLVPTREQWRKLVKFLDQPVPLRVRNLVLKIVRNKGQPGDAWFEREKVGEKTVTDAKHSRPGFGAITARDGKVKRKKVDVTAAASDDARAWVGYGTALKPGYEPVCLARAPLEGTIAENVLKHGTGALAIDACRIGVEAMPKTKSTGKVSTLNRAMGGPNYERESDGVAVGRWPANVTLDQVAAAMLDAQSGISRKVEWDAPRAPHKASISASPIGGAKDTPKHWYGDEGGASRFFFSAKASPKDREHGTDGMTKYSPDARGTTQTDRMLDGVSNSKKEGALGGAAANFHPTVKPTRLNEWLARLILPPPAVGRRLLIVPFSGSGSEMIGALRAGWDGVVGIELDPNYAIIARTRLTQGDTEETEEEALQDEIANG